VDSLVDRQFTATGAGIGPSVGSVGNSYDNVLAESIIGIYKTELIYRHGPWKGLEDVELAALTYLDWFNNRILEPIGDIPPAEQKPTTIVRTVQPPRPDSSKRVSD